MNSKHPFYQILFYSKLRRAASVLLSVLMLLNMQSCTRVANDTGVDNAHSLTFFAMDTAMSIKAYGEDRIFEYDDPPLEAARDLAEALERKLSVTDEGSMIYRINHSNGAAASVDSETLALLGSALELCDKTEGNLDISIYPLVRAWGFTTDVYRVPGSDEIENLLKITDYRRIILSSEPAPEDPGTDDSTAKSHVLSGSVKIENGMMIDLGAVAKGYAAEKIAGLLREKGIGSAVISLGGNIKTIGTKPDGSDWNIAIAAPARTGSDSYESPPYAGFLRVSDMSVVTSGGYERYFEEGGKTYCHIIDPSSGRPVDKGILSVTIVATDSLICDGLSTALFVMGADRATAYWRDNPEFDFIIITDENEILVTEGIENIFTPDENYIKGISGRIRAVHLQ